MSLIVNGYPKKGKTKNKKSWDMCEYGNFVWI